MCKGDLQWLPLTSFSESVLPLSVPSDAGGYTQPVRFCLGEDHVRSIHLLESPDPADSALLDSS